MNALCESASPQDIPEILKIQDALLLPKQGRPAGDGFLLMQHTAETFSSCVEKRELVVAKNESGAVLGYLWFRPYYLEWLEEEIHFENELWLPQLKNCGNIRHLQQVAVGPQARGQGIGQRLYEWLFEQHSSATFTALVATRPARNDRSLHFHAKLGFKQIGRTQSASWHGIDDFEAAVFARKRDK